MKAIKVKLYPKPKQAKMFEKHFGCCRSIYNFGLELKTKTYQETKQHVSYSQISAKLIRLKEERPWLSEINSQTLQQSLKDLESAFSHFFKKNNSFPKFKSKRNTKQSFRIPQHFQVTKDKHYIKLPKIGYVHFKDEFNIPKSVEFRNITVSREGNEYFASICYDTHKETPVKFKIEEEKTLGIDLGVRTLVALSDGTKIENPKHLKKFEEKLAIEQRKLPAKELKETEEIDVDRKKIKQSSGRRNKQVLKVNKIHKKIRNIRKDFLHKLTSSLIKNQDWTSFCMEDLNVKEMIEENYSPMSKLIGDAGWRMMRGMMEYKTDEVGKNLIVIGRFDASSKTCNKCGHIYHSLGRNEKFWTCEKCNTFHDRDLNASENIKIFGLIKNGICKSLGKDFSLTNESESNLEPTVL